MINFSDPMLDPISADDAGTMDRLRQLVAAAEADQLLDVAYRTVDSPVGALLVAATDQGLVRVAYEREDHDHVLQGLGAGSARAFCGLHVASIRRLANLRSISLANAEISCCRWTAGSWVPAGGARAPCVDQLRAYRDVRRGGRSHRSCTGRTGSRLLVPPTRSRWWCHAIGCCAATGSSAAISVGWRRRRLCSHLRPAGPSTAIHCWAKRLGSWALPALARVS